MSVPYIFKFLPSFLFSHIFWSVYSDGFGVALTFYDFLFLSLSFFLFSHLILKN